MENYLTSEKRAAWLKSPARKTAIEAAYRRREALTARPGAAIAQPASEGTRPGFEALLESADRLRAGMR